MSGAATEITVDLGERPEILVAVTPPSQYNQNLCHTIKTLRERFGHGVIITANRPYHVLARSLREAGISMEGLEFIDCISAMTGQPPPNERGVTYIDGPLLLEMIALRAQQFVRFMPQGDRFVLLDSLSTLSLYNGPGPVTEMTHTLSTRMRLLQATTVLFSLKDMQQGEMLEAIAGYCDRTLEL